MSANELSAIQMKQIISALGCLDNAAEACGNIVGSKWFFDEDHNLDEAQRVILKDAMSKRPQMYTLSGTQRAAPILTHVLGGGGYMGERAMGVVLGDDDKIRLESIVVADSVDSPMLGALNLYIRQVNASVDRVASGVKAFAGVQIGVEATEESVKAIWVDFLSSKREVEFTVQGCAADFSSEIGLNEVEKILCSFIDATYIASLSENETIIEERQEEPQQESGGMETNPLWGTW
jgi:hypothetical protein